MVKSVFDELRNRARRTTSWLVSSRTSRTQLGLRPSFNTEPDDVVRGVFYGLGSDGTVGATRIHSRL